MLVGWLRVPRGDLVDVHVERPRGRRVRGESHDAGFLERLTQRDGLSAELARVPMAARLQPATQLAVVKEKHALEIGGNHDGAPCQMALRDSTVEWVGVSPREVPDPCEVPGFFLVRRTVALQETHARIVPACRSPALAEHRHYVPPLRFTAPP